MIPLLIHIKSENCQLSPWATNLAYISDYTPAQYAWFSRGELQIIVQRASQQTDVLEVFLCALMDPQH